VIESYKSFLEYSKSKNTLLIIASPHDQPSSDPSSRILYVSNMTSEMQSSLLHHSSILLFTQLSQSISNL
jgi:hypothetical protein